MNKSIEHASIAGTESFLSFSFKIEPFCSYKDSSGQLIGNEQYEGFAIDLLEEIAKLLKFKYTIQIITGYENKKNNVTQKWEGMMGMILNDVSLSESLTIRNSNKEITKTVSRLQILL